MSGGESRCDFTEPVMRVQCLYVNLHYSGRKVLNIQSEVSTATSAVDPPETFSLRLRKWLVVPEGFRPILQLLLVPCFLTAIFSTDLGVYGVAGTGISLVFGFME